MAPTWINRKPKEHFEVCNSKCAIIMGGDEMRSGYMVYVQGIQPNAPARTTCRHGLYTVHARTSLSVLEGRAHTIELYHTNSLTNVLKI